MRQYLEYKACVRECVEVKGVPNLLVKNLTYLLQLFQLLEHISLPTVCKTMEDSPKCQQITTLQHAFDYTTQRLGVRSPIITTPSLLNMYLALGFFLNHRDNLEAGMHQFLMVQHTYAARKVLKVCVDQHQFIAGGNGAPKLVESAYLTAPDGVTFPKTVAMVRSTHARLRVVL